MHPEGLGSAGRDSWLVSESMGGFDSGRLKVPRLAMVGLLQVGSKTGGHTVDASLNGGLLSAAPTQGSSMIEQPITMPCPDSVTVPERFQRSLMLRQRAWLTPESGWPLR